MVHIRSGLSIAVLATSLPFAAQAAPTTLPFDNRQPSIVLNEAFATSGVYPSTTGPGCACVPLGTERMFAFGYAPGNSISASGQPLAIASNPALFSIVGSTFGGNGVATFALPNLQGQAAVGTGQGPGPAAQMLGVPTGAASPTLTGGPSGILPFSNLQPSFPLTPLINIGGSFPSQSTPAQLGFLGQLIDFAGATPPSGYALADGRLLPIAQDPALFAVLGTTYGGNGITTFALPNLLGRLAVGASVTDPVGTSFGQQTVTLTAAQTPTGGNVAALPFDNQQPSLAVNYLISTSGTFLNPQFGSLDSFTPTLGEITEFAGGVAPTGWMFADGQFLPISQYSALFSEIGTTFGGDGFVTFALPDLRGRTPIGEGGMFSIGQLFGSASVDLAANEVPAAPSPVPEPGSAPILATALGAVAAGRGFTRRWSSQLRP